MACKATFFFSVRGKVGFSESWIIDSASTPAAIAPLILRQISNASMKLRGIQTALDGIRITALAPPRATLLIARDTLVLQGYDVQGTFNIPPQPSLSNDSDFGDTSIMITRTGIGQNPKSNFFLRGVPDQCITLGGTFNNVGNFRTNLENWRVLLFGSGWGWYSRPASKAGFPTTISNATQDPVDGTVSFGLFAAPFLNADIGKRFNARISGQVTSKTLNGTLVVQCTAVGACKSIRLLPLGPFTGGTGKMDIKGAPQFNLPNQMEVRKIVERRGGRPFDLYRGRSKPGRST